MDVDAQIIGDAAVRQGFAQGFVSVLKFDIFAHDGDGHFAVGGFFDGADQRLPSLKTGWLNRRVNAQSLDNEFVKFLFMKGQRHFVNSLYVARGDDGGFLDVAKQRDFGAQLARDVPIRTTQQNIRHNADFAQFAHGMLRWLGL